jgi:hypothetical protein
MSLPEIRPLSFGETLDRSFAFYRSHFLPLAAISLITGLIIAPMSLLVRVPTGFVPDASTLWAWVAGIYTYMFVALFVHYLGMAASVFAISEMYLGRTATVVEAYRRMAQRFWALTNLWISILLRVVGVILLAILAGGFLAGGVTLVLLVLKMPGGRVAGTVIGIIVAIALMCAAFLPFLWYSFAVQVLLVEKISANKALKRSRQLTKGMRGQIFLTYLLMIILAYTVAFVAQAPFLILSAKIVPKGQLPPIWLTLMSGLLGAAGGAVTAPPLTVAFTLLYYNTRVLREGFDLQLMLDRLGSGTPAGATAAAVVAPEVAPVVPAMESLAGPESPPPATAETAPEEALQTASEPHAAATPGESTAAPEPVATDPEAPTPPDSMNPA